MSAALGRGKEPSVEGQPAVADGVWMPEGEAGSPRKATSKPPPHRACTGWRLGYIIPPTRSVSSKLRAHCSLPWGKLKCAQGSSPWWKWTGKLQTKLRHWENTSDLPASNLRKRNSKPMVCCRESQEWEHPNSADTDWVLQAAPLRTHWEPNRRGVFL